MKGKPTVLVVDDEAQDLTLVRDYLSPKGFQVIEAQNGKEAIGLFSDKSPDIVVLDYLLPDMLGIKACQQMKSIASHVPILILTNVNDTTRKVEAFRMGCDDYMVKPCELEELEIRISNLLKRASAPRDLLLKIDNIELDRASRKVTKDGNILELTMKEFQLLEYLLQNKGKILSRTMILERIWGEDSGTFTNIVDVYVNYLRNKIDSDSRESYIKTVRGVGYTIEQPVAKAA